MSAEWEDAKGAKSGGGYGLNRKPPPEQLLGSHGRRSPRLEVTIIFFPSSDEKEGREKNLTFFLVFQL